MSYNSTLMKCNTKKKIASILQRDYSAASIYVPLLCEPLHIKTINRKINLIIQIHLFYHNEIDEINRTEKIHVF